MPTASAWSRAGRDLAIEVSERSVSASNGSSGRSNGHAPAPRGPFVRAFDAGEVIWVNDLPLFTAAQAMPAPRPATKRTPEVTLRRATPRPPELRRLEVVHEPAARSAPAPQDARLVAPHQLAWLAAALVGVIAWTASLLAPSFAEAILPRAGWDAFPSLKDVGWFRPEPFDQMRHLISLSVPLALIPLALKAWRKVSACRPLPRLDTAVMAVQVVGAALVVVSWIIQRSYIRWYTGWDLIVALVVGCGLLALSRVGGLSALARSERRRGPTLALSLVAAAGLSGMWLLPLVTSGSQVAGREPSFGYHMQFLLDEFLAALNGRTAGVDFIPQYSKLLPYAVEPVLRTYGATLGTLTWALWGLSLVALLAVYLMFRLVTRSSVLGLVLFVPFVPIAVSGSYLLPVRLFGPLVAACLCALHLRRPRRYGEVAIFVFSGLVLYNNPELGLPSFVAVFAALWLGGQRVRPGWRRLRTLGATAVAGTLGSFAVVATISLARSSTLPRWDYVNHFTRVFAVEGFGLAPMPLFGLHLIIYLSFLGAVVGAATRAYGRAEDPNRVLTGSLAFSGVFGLLGFSYWVGRSQPASLITVLPLWGLCVALLAWWAMSAVGDRGRPSSPAVRLWALPTLAVMTAFGLLTTGISPFPSPSRDMDRLNTTFTPTVTGPGAYENGVIFDRAAAVRFVSANTRRGERVAILASLGHGVAERSGVVDVSPFSHQDSIVFTEQMDLFWRELERTEARKIFLGRSYPEIAAYLERKGYVVVAEDKGSELRLWEPKAAR